MMKFLKYTFYTSLFFSLLLIIESCKTKKPIAKTSDTVVVIDSVGNIKYNYRHRLFPNQTKPAFLAEVNTSKKSWADSIFETLTIEEKIAQLFMVAAYSNKGQAHVDEITELVKKYKIGGLIWMQGGPMRQAQLCNYYQSISTVPLINSIDGEWGLAMRLDSTVRYPKQMTLGALQDDGLIYEMGKEIAEQCTRIGLQINFAPVVDVNNNPSNPVISNRSFGEDKYKVADKGLAYMRGLQENGVMSNAKHFPGHGDTDSDSHLTLPSVNQSKARIDSLELYPFKKLFANGLSSIMVAHLSIPSLDSTKNRPSTLSKNIVTGLLREELGFEGLVFTDALNMKGVSKFYSPGEVDWRALLAGNDVLLFAEDVPSAIEKIKDRICDSLILGKEIDEHCMKVLRAKEWTGLNKYKPVDLKNLQQDLNQNKAQVLIRDIIENSITVLKNENNLIPIRKLDTLKIATLAFNTKNINTFQKRISDYANADHYFAEGNFSIAMQDSLFKTFKNYNLVVIGLFDLTNKPETNFGISSQIKMFIDSLAKTNNVIVNIFGNPYSIGKMNSTKNLKGLVMSYQDTDPTQDLTAQLLFGGISSHGRLPVSVSTEYKLGSGIDTDKPIRLKFSTPEEVGFKNNYIAKIDSVIYDAIFAKAMPGCQVYAAKDGKVFFNKSYGYQTYDKVQAVSNEDLYDLASVTKILASVPTLMKMQDSKYISLDKTLGDYLPLKNTNKEGIILREMLAHQAGLPAWIPFWKESMNSDGTFNPTNYSFCKNDTFCLIVTDQIYINKCYTDTIYNRLYNCSIDPNKHYLYSDLGYYFVKKIAEKQYNSTFDVLTDSLFYKPLGLKKLTYKPYKKFSLDMIAPTEEDVAFRHQQLRGYVHDQGAAMTDGVGGHAGLFANATAVGTMMQVYLNGGTYGGEKYFEKSTLEDFTRVQFPANNNRRGAGFDKPETAAGKESPTCKSASPQSFGHSGFTGTYTWADPKTGIVYVFLSNRIYPSVDNKKLLQLNVRTQVQELFYEGFQKN